MEKRYRVDVSVGAAILYPLLYFLDENGLFSVLLPAAAIHELGHWAAIAALKGTVTAIRLDSAGLCMETAGIGGLREEALCALAGPAAGFVLFFLASAFPYQWSQKCAAASLLLSLFNLFPAAPLDGGRLLLALTGSLCTVRLCSAASALLLTAAAFHWESYVLLIPTVLIVKSIVSP